MGHKHYKKTKKPENSVTMKTKENELDKSFIEFREDNNNVCLEFLSTIFNFYKLNLYMYQDRFLV